MELEEAIRVLLNAPDDAVADLDGLHRNILEQVRDVSEGHSSGTR